MDEFGVLGKNGTIMLEMCDTEILYGECWNKVERRAVLKAVTNLPIP
jgi:hypothetical protein